MNRALQTGALAELKTAQYFIENGYDVFTPLSLQPSADLVVVKNGETIRIQVKAAHIITKPSGSSYLCTSFHKYPSYEDYDLLLVSYENRLWAFPVDDVKHLRTITLEKNQEINKSPENNFKAQQYQIQ